MIYQSSYDVGGEPTITKKSGFNKALASSEVSADIPVMDGTASVGDSENLARANHVHPHDSTKVDVISGKQLSTEDFTTTLKNKLDGISAGAEVNVQSNWSETDTTADAYIQNKPEILAVSGYTSADEGKIAKVVEDGGAYKLEVTTAGTTSVSWNDVTDKPSSFTPSTHATSHQSGGADAVYLDASQINSGVFDIARIPAAAVPTLKVVANDTARFALTTDDVQNGDSVYVTESTKMYMVKDQTQLNNENGYQQYTATATWGAIQGTLSSQSDLNTRFNTTETNVSNLTTTVSGHTTSIGTLQTDLGTAQTDIDNLETAVAGKVDKVSGKGLSTNDYTTTEKNKLALLEVSEDIPFMATMTKSGKDSNNIYTVITWELATAVEGHPAKWVSTLSGGTSPSYTTRTLIVYDDDKVTPLSTYTYTRAYDSDGILISETPTKS